MSVGDEEERRIGKLHGHSFIVVPASEARTAVHPRGLGMGEKSCDPAGALWSRIAGARPLRGGQRRDGDHVPTRPNCGLDGSAWASFGMRPAKQIGRPASTAARMLLAMVKGSRGFETGVLRSHAEQPRSRVSAASRAVRVAD